MSWNLCCSYFVPLFRIGRACSSSLHEKGTIFPPVPTFLQLRVHKCLWFIKCRLYHEWHCQACTQKLGSPIPGLILAHGLLGTGPHSRKGTVDFHETSPWCQKSWGPLFWSSLTLIIWPPPQGEPLTLTGELSFARSSASCYWHKSNLSAVYIMQIDQK